MGSWSSTPFGNDTALDWLAKLKESKGHSALTAPLEAVLKSKTTPDSSDCEEAIASAAVMRAAFGTSLRSVPDDARKWIVERAYVPQPKQMDRAILALTRIVEDSELLETWSETRSGARWKISVQSLMDALKTARATPLPQRIKKQPAPPRLLCKLIDVISPDEQSSRRDKLQQELASLVDLDAPLPRTVREPPLCLLAARGLVPEAMSLLDRGANPNVESGTGYGPLVYAAGHGQATMVALLAARGAQLDKTIFVHKNTRVPVLSTDKDAVAYTYTRGLFSAARQGSIPTLQAFAALGVDLHQIDLNGETLLHKAAEGAQIQTLEYLANYGLDIDRTKNLNETPLHYAVRAQRIEAVRCLLILGANPNIVGGVDGTPLDILRNPKGPIGRLLRGHGGKLASELSL